ncbi:NAD-dependent epimerase/dehydratase family protein [Bdellovibrionota bacterium FG-1]
MTGYASSHHWCDRFFGSEYCARASAQGPPKREVFEQVDAVVHLAGEPVAGHRWTDDQQKRILDSRILGTRHLWEGIEASQKSGYSRLKSFVSASAIGFYGNRGDDVLSEHLGPGDGFLSQVCQAWEAQIFNPSIPAVRQVAVRIGIVLGREGGALSKLWPLYYAGLGGPVGGGRQWMSWVHVEDVAAVFVAAVENAGIQGPAQALRIHGTPMAWCTRIEDWEPNKKFVDVQLKGPYVKWHHTHSFQSVGSGTLMTDDLRYRLRLGGLGNIFGLRFVRRDVEQIFAYRRQRIRELFLTP